MLAEDKISQKRWKFLFHKTPPDYKKIKKIGEKEYSYLKKFVNGKAGKFLEIGCGMGACALEVSRHRDWKTFGIDYCLDNLIGANRYWKYFNFKPNLTHGDVNNMPFSDNTFDLLYGSGVLEHMYDTQRAVNETFRVLKPGGISVNTVPTFSLASLTYRQLSGTIPDLPILKQIYEFVHIKLLQRKFMHTGYEKCFSKTRLIKIYKNAGFSKVRVFHDSRFVPYMKSFPKPLKHIIRRLEKKKLFWAWYVIEAWK